MKMRLVTCALLALAIIAATPGFAAIKAELIVPTSVQPDDHARARLDSLLYDFAVFELDTADLNERVRSTGEVSLYFNNQRFDLVLEPNDLRGPGYREVVMFDDGPVTLPERPVTTFKGHVAGDPSSDVRLSVTGDRFDGYIKTDADWVFIDPLNRFSDKARAGQVVVYRDAAVRPGTWNVPVSGVKLAPRTTGSSESCCTGCSTSFSPVSSAREGAIRRMSQPSGTTRRSAAMRPVVRSSMTWLQPAPSRNS